MTCSACSEREAKTKGLCRRCYLRKWHKENPAANRGFTAKWRRSRTVTASQQGKARKYAGWQPGEHEKAEAALANVWKSGCACCGSMSPRRKKMGWCADHDHRTGLFRGILCQPCNIRIGYSEKYGLGFTSMEERYLNGQ